VSFFSYFTVLTNTLVASVLTCAVTRRESAARRWFLQPWVSSGIAVSIAVVGLAYSLCCGICGIRRAGSLSLTNCCTT
jgi:hypothetical protein